MEKIIAISHENIEGYTKRKSAFFQILLSQICFYSIALFSDKINTKIYVVLYFLFSLCVALVYSYHNYNKLLFYLVDFYSDSEKITVVYFKKNNQLELNTTLNKVKVSLHERTTRSGFKCEMKISIENINFVIEKNTDWEYQEMKKLFLYIKFHKQEKLTENEKSLLSGIEEHLKKYPF